MNETQKSMSDWALATFGEQSKLGVSARALEEGVEMLSKIAGGEHVSAADKLEEAADTGVVLSILAERVGLDMRAAANRYRALCSPETPMEIAAARALVAMTRIHVVLSVQQVHSTRLAAAGAAPDFGVAWYYLAIVATRLGGVLSDSIDAKMAINRARKWSVDKSGRGQHTS